MFSNNYFDRLTRSRNAAIYAWLRAQNARAIPVTGEPGAGGEGLKTDNGDTPDESTVKPTEVSDASAIQELLDSDEPEVSVVATESFTVSGEKSIVVEPGKTLNVTVPEGVTISAGDISDPDTKDTVFAVRNGGTLVVDGNGTIAGGDGQYAGIKMTVKDPPTFLSAKGKAPAKLIVNGGTIRGKYYAICGNGTRSGSEIVINGGTLEGLETNDSTAIFNPQGDSSVTVNGGTLKGAMCVYMKSGKLTINGGTFVANGAAAPYKKSGNGFNNTGDCIIIDNCGYPGEPPTAEIAGGKFTSENNHAFASYNTAGHDKVVGFVDKAKVEVVEAVASDEDVYA